MSAARRRVRIAPGLWARAWAIGLTVLGVAPATRADTSLQVPVGPRAIALGGAYSALSDDAASIFWNPAGLSLIGHQEFATSRADLYDSGIVDTYAAFALPLTRRYAVATDWYHSGYEDQELRFAENRFDVSLASVIHERVRVGATFKYMSRRTELDGVSVRDGGGLGADLGVLLRPWKTLALALVSQDMFGTDIEYSNGQSVLVLPRNTRFAAAYQYRMASVALDVDDRLHLGAELVPWNVIALRAGFQDDSEDDATLAFGAGINVRGLSFDYAYEAHPELGGTNHFGVALAFNFNPSLIQIEQVKVSDLYSSLYKTYARDAVGSVRVTSRRDEPLAVTLAVLVPGLMRSATESQILVRPNTTQDFPIVMAFSEEVMQLRDDRTIQVEISATYESARLPRTDKASGNAVLFAPGAIDWGGGLAQAAAFVTPRDPVVDAVAHEASRAVTLEGDNPFPNRNIGLAAALFHALNVIGVAYVPDPQHPYADVSETAHFIDTIQYPRQTLSKRSGDCDDTSVLMAALLQNVGVRVKLVDAPGHLMILFATDVHERNQLGLGLGEQHYVVLDREVWIPLETTALGRDFTAAWGQGAEAYQGWSSRNQVQLSDVNQAQTRFVPAVPADAPVVPPFDTGEVKRCIDADAIVVAGWRGQYLAGIYPEDVRKASVSVVALNDVARLHFGAGQLELAEANLRRALDTDSRSARTLNNLGVLLLSANKAPEARQRFAAALAIDDTDAGMWLNLGLAIAAEGDLPALDHPVEEALRRSGGYSEACAVLGLDAGATAPSSGQADDARLRDTLLRLARPQEPLKAGPELATLPAYWKP